LNIGQIGLTSGLVSGFLNDLVPNARVTAPEFVDAALVSVNDGALVVDLEVIRLCAFFEGGGQVGPLLLVDDGELPPVEVIQQGQQRLSHLKF